MLYQLLSTSSIKHMFALSPIFSALDYHHGHVYSINAKPIGTLDQMMITLKADRPRPGGNLHYI